MLSWQKQGYLDRQIWHSRLFSPSLLPQHPSAANKITPETPVSPITPMISDQEREAFENEQLDPAIWVPKICQHFSIEELKFLKGLERVKINEFLDGIKNTTIQSALRSFLRELKCLYIPPIEIEHLTDLPDIIDKRRKYLILNKDEDDEMKFNGLIDLLESTIWKWHQSSSSSYEFLTCLATMSLFGFSLEELSFNDNLKGKDVEKLSVALRENFSEIKTMNKSKNKQAFVLNIALNNPFERKIVVEYILKHLKDEICPKFTSCITDKFDLIKLQQTVENALA